MTKKPEPAPAANPAAALLPTKGGAYIVENGDLVRAKEPAEAPVNPPLNEV